jgi:hydrogenase expression/formation protein HypC
MCLGIPGKITEVYLDNNMHMGKVDFGGVLREVCLEAVDEAQVDDYVIVHAGFALSILSEDEAMETLRILNEMSLLADEMDEIAASGGETA